MNKLQILRRATKPTTEAKVAEIVRSRYGVRENASNDDNSVVLRAQVLNRRKAEKQASSFVVRQRRFAEY